MSAIDVMMTLLHFLWQGTAIGAIAIASTWLARSRSAGLRHNINLFALFACVASVLVTACYLRGTVPVLDDPSVQPIVGMETRIIEPVPVTPMTVCLRVKR